MPEGKSLSCGMECNRWLLFIFNGLFVLAGVIIIIIGAYSLSQMVNNKSPIGVAVFVLVIGCIMFITAFFGCCGAIQKSVWMLRTFGALLIIILVLTVVALIAAFVLRNKVPGALESLLRDTIVSYDTVLADQQSWDSYQKSFQCCGFTNYTDWSANKNLSATFSVPNSCCINDTVAQCGKGQLNNPTNIYRKACKDGVVSAGQFAYLILGCIAAAIAILMVIGIILAFCLADALHKDYQVV